MGLQDAIAATETMAGLTWPAPQFASRTERTLSGTGSNRPELSTGSPLNGRHRFGTVKALAPRVASTVRGLPGTPG
jgi:hypothetical protein